MIEKNVFFPPRLSEAIVGGSYYGAPAISTPPYRVQQNVKIVFIFYFIFIFSKISRTADSDTGTGCRTRASEFSSDCLRVVVQFDEPSKYPHGDEGIAFLGISSWESSNDIVQASVSRCSVRYCSLIPC